MARAGCKTNGLQKLEGDDIEKSLELLDRVLSEFEDPDSLPQIEPESPSQDNQSEDDGYMSMNGRRAKISPDFCHNHSPDHEESQINHKSQSESLSSFTLPDIRTIASINQSVVIKTTDDDGDNDDDNDDDDIEETKSSTSLPLSMGGKIDDGMILNLLPRSLSTETTINITNSSTSNNNNNNNTVVLVKSSKDYDKLTNNKSKDFQKIFTENNVDFSNNKRKSQQINLDPSSRVNEKGNNADDDDNDDNDGSSNHKKTDDNNDVKGNDNNCSSNNIRSSLDVKQVTSPKKSRPLNVIPSRYSSLPCNGPIKNSLFSGSFDGIEMKGTTIGNGSFDDERNVLGIGISAVHDAVLRGGVAKLPEPIVNEHPVTIYPGRASPPRTTRVPPRTLPGSIERHREVCRNPNFLMTGTTTTTDNGGRIAWQIDKTQFIPLQFIEKTAATAKLLSSSSSSSSPVNNEHTSASQAAVQSFKRYHHKSYIDNDIDDNNDNTHHFFIHHNNNSSSPSKSDYFIAEDKNQFIKNFVASANKQNNIDDIRIRNKKQQEINCDSEEFSDDSLEGQSLPPPPPPPVVPPPPSLSAPVTPSKRGSIAWEISLDDNFPPPPPLHQSHSHNSTMHSLKRNKTAIKEKASLKQLESSSSLSSSKPIKKSRERSVLGSESSLNSTPGNSINSLSNNYSLQSNNLRNRASSVEWPEPPDPPVCSTEDEAASLYSDSDELIPVRPATMTNQGTYVIRKGRRERNRLPDFNNSVSSSSNTNYRLSNRSGSQEYSQTQSQILFTPNSRHSIDLGSSPQISTQHSALSPRSRLSLDLNPHPVPATSEQYRTADLSNNSVGGIKIISGSSPITTNNSTQKAGSLSSCYSEFEIYDKAEFDALQSIESSKNSNDIKVNQTMTHDSNTNLNSNAGNITTTNNTDTISNSSESLKRGSPITTIGQQQQVQNEIISTPRRELAPPIEEDEEQDSESQRVGVPLRQIENNISALLRGDIAVARIGDISSHARRPLGFRPGVHKSESAKEMLLAQLNAFGPLPPSPHSSSPEPEIDRFPPLPPSPQEIVAENEDEPDNETISSRDKYGFRINSRTRLKSDVLQLNRDEMPPAVPPHRGLSSLNTLKTRSMDTSYSKKYMYNTTHSNNSPGTLPSELPTTRKRLMSGALPKRSVQNSREEIRLQTSCSLPETPIFARGCDIARTPHRRVPDTSNIESRTAPRTNTINSSSIAGIGGGSGQRCMNQILVSGEMLRLAGGPARGWYPKQRNMRPASTEHLDRLHRSQRSMRAWDANSAQGTGGGINGRKPLTLPPNLTPKFFNKSPREALRRVTSLLIKKGNSGKDKESKREKEAFAASAVHRSPGSAGDIPVDKISITDVSSVNHQQQQQQQQNHHHHKKKGFFKSFWKKSRHYSLDQ